MTVVVLGSSFLPRLPLGAKAVRSSFISESDNQVSGEGLSLFLLVSASLPAWASSVAFCCGLQHGRGVCWGSVLLRVPVPCLCPAWLVLLSWLSDLARFPVPVCCDPAGAACAVISDLSRSMPPACAVGAVCLFCDLCPSASRRARVRRLSDRGGVGFVIQRARPVIERGARCPGVFLFAVAVCQSARWASSVAFCRGLQRGRGVRWGRRYAAVCGHL